MRYGFPMILHVIIQRMIDKLLKYYDLFQTRVKSCLWRVKIGTGAILQGNVIIRTRWSGQIVIGENVIINARSRCNLIGMRNECILDVRAGGRIEIGHHSQMSGIVISSSNKVVIGNHVKLGANVRIFDNDFHALAAADRRGSEKRDAIRNSPITIGDDVFIGTNAVILKGSHIGARSIVAAGSVVFGLDVPPDCLVKGNPAVISSRKKMP